jgi:hypothetical protein
LLATTSRNTPMAAELADGYLDVLMTARHTPRARRWAAEQPDDDSLGPSGTLRMGFMPTRTRRDDTAPVRRSSPTASTAAKGGCRGARNLNGRREAFESRDPDNASFAHRADRCPGGSRL